MKKIYILSILFAAISLSSCDDFLDVMPDNRAEVDSEEKVQKLLVSAYSMNSYIMVTELSSDNLDDYGPTNPYTSRFWEQLFNWIDVTEANNESPARIWEGCYNAIASANQALSAIDEMGNPESLQPARGEALLCRAYAHFVLVNVFSLHYSPLHSDKDLGIPYMESSETELDPKYERPTVAENYELIKKDLEEGLPLINDAVYSVPKYHFNKKAANAFASRFYLYSQDWDNVIKSATSALGVAPASLLRNNAELATYPRDMTNVGTQYISASAKANFLLMTGYSTLGPLFGPYYTGSRHAHGALISETETIQSNGPWGDYLATFHLAPYVYKGTNLDKTLLPRLPYLFEYTDPVAGTGYSRTVHAALTADETLLNRAEAYILKKDYTNALKDMNLWVANTLKTGYVLTEADIVAWNERHGYYEPKNPTPRKKLDPDFELDKTQENYVQCLLYLRRHETMHMGLRWFDMKRYGMEATRRVIASGEVSSLGSTLTKRDNRYAIQIPADVVDAGITPNPR
ncbi:RagB/SusD family nutrient uptake outer membrane protein [Bacteroides sp. 51]|uniref:RagB/SusD family nutrient uptake outer membrane protein n=1 Tax=Bacteroides sp. 51 TaxID=2302938 RepID=UPI0013D27516|nr:RagB/SusD family nutrient uptake outer membrane protein [Bacteroides sp. 51]NDV83018.1 RagB/SusD family nutrient uptake outer membrane protein [Bacteroides sp. 51]